DESPENRREDRSAGNAGKTLESAGQHLIDDGVPKVHRPFFVVTYYENNQRERAAELAQILATV
ncbi:MAG: hypothetical protein AAF408_15015, partial [Pseudomonadota bacterium]